MISQKRVPLGLSPDERDHCIIERLSTSKAPVSGELLAFELGMSRVALWKRIESLKAWGYGIKASRKGYELCSNDGLAGWELDSPGPVLLFDTVGSTMDEARTFAESGVPSGATVLALGQSAGRGRNGSVWESPAGGLYLSVVLRSQLPPSHAGALGLEAALQTLDALSLVGLTSLGYSWPGSITSSISCQDARKNHQRKVGGVLVEIYGDIGRADFYIVGIGLNCAPRELGALGGSSGSGAPARRSMLAAGIVRSLVSWAANPQLDPARWRSLVPGKGNPMVVELWNGSRRTLVPVGFNDRGDIVASKDGPAISIGECCHIYSEGEAE